jgi:hypothetical protein
MPRCVELGHIDIMSEASMLSSKLCMPRGGHVEAVYLFISKVWSEWIYLISPWEMMHLPRGYVVTSK